MLKILNKPVELRARGAGTFGSGPWGSWPGDTATKTAVTVTEITCPAHL